MTCSAFNNVVKKMYACINADTLTGTLRSHSSNLCYIFLFQEGWIFFTSLFHLCSNCWKHQHKVPSTKTKWGRLPQAAKLCNTKPQYKEFSSIETAVNATKNPRKLCTMLQNAPQGSSACYLLTPSLCKAESVQRSVQRLPRGPTHSVLTVESFRSHKEDNKELWLPQLKLLVRNRSLPSKPLSLAVWIFSCPLDRWLVYQTGLSVLLGVIWILL